MQWVAPLASESPELIVARWVIVVLSALYAVLVIGQLVRRRRSTARIVRDGLVTPFEEFEKAGAEQR